ncbi:PIG-P-domain-containing protein [Boletus reticuloceps]|uniref:PIG-P-domain-containing protein n=1 Tax=Boletus reticuloceps TaxID=495285 RepID=A0A8I2YVA9_9AGAM|nr:PIG-P-domain-containing protein [Boletus reticuloceps]
MQPTSLVPLACAPTEPPCGHRSQAPEFYGFVAWSSTSVLFVVYVLWALLPDEYIVWLGVKWYPSREWSLLLPAYSIVLVLLTYFVYISLAVAHTPSFSDVSAIIDSKGHLPELITPNPYLKHADTSIVPELYDIPIGIVNRVLYGPKIKAIHSRSR